MQRCLSQEVVSLFGLMRVVTMVRRQKEVVGWRGIRARHCLNYQSHSEDWWMWVSFTYFFILTHWHIKSTIEALTSVLDSGLYALHFSIH